MNEIKSLTKDGYTLTHSWYIDPYSGLKRNSFDLFNEKTRTNYPFMGKMRINNYTRSTPIEGDDTSPYTDKEYEEMLDEEVAITNTLAHK